MQLKSQRIGAILLVILLSFISFYSASAHSSYLKDNSQDERVVKFALDKYIPPYCYENENDNLIGFNIDLLNAMEKYTNLTFRYVGTKWDQALSMLVGGDVDAVMAIVPTPERNKTFLFTQVYQYLYFNFFQRGNMPSINKLDQIENHTLVVIRNDITEIFAKNWMNKTHKKLYLVYVDTPTEALELVNANSADFFLYEIHTASYIISKMKLNNVKLTNVEAFSIPIAIAVRKNLTWLVQELNYAIEAVKNSGEYTSIYNKWFNPPPSSPIPIYFYYALVAFIISIAVIIAIGIKYKKTEEEVKQQRRRVMNLVALSQTLMENMPIGILYVRDGRCLYANPEALKILNYDFEEINNTKIFEKLLNNKEEVSIRTKDGHRKWLYVKSIDYKGGKIISIIDITRRKNLEIIEKERFEYLNNMLDALRNPMQNIIFAAEDIENKEMQRVIKKEISKIIDILRREPK